VGQLAPRNRGHAGAELDRHDLAASLRHRHRRLPGAAADLQHAAPRPDPGQPLQLVEQLGRIPWPRPVIQLGGLVKGSAQPHPVPRVHARKRTAVSALTAADG